MSKEIGPREAALRAMREARLSEIEAASADVRRKGRDAARSADKGAELVKRIEAAKLKRGKPRKAKVKK